MKVVDVAEFYAEQGGGVRTYINQKLAAGAAAGHEVVVIAPGPKDAEEGRLGGRVVWVKGPPLPPDPRYYVLWNERAVHRALDRERPDVVEGSSPWSGGWFAARWRGDAAKAFIFHQDPVAVYPQTFLGATLGARRVDRLFGWYWAYLRRLAGRFDATVVSGQWLAERLHGFGLDNAVAVPFGIDKHHFGPTRRDPETRRELLRRCGLGEDAALVITVSRLHPEKRIFTLLGAIERARERRPVGLVLLGVGPLERLVRRKARALGGVYMPGYLDGREEVARALASADVMLHGSAAETYGLVVAEGLCSGLPVVVPAEGGAADFADPRWAETYRPGDPEAAASALLRLLERDRAELSAAAAQGCADRVGTMADHFEGLFRLYERLASAHCAGGHRRGGS